MIDINHSFQILLVNKKIKKLGVLITFNVPTKKSQHENISNHKQSSRLHDSVNYNSLFS